MPASMIGCLIFKAFVNGVCKDIFDTLEMSDGKQNSSNNSNVVRTTKSTIESIRKRLNENNETNETKRAKSNNSSLAHEEYARKASNEPYTAQVMSQITVNFLFSILCSMYLSKIHIFPYYSVNMKDLMMKNLMNLNYLYNVHMIKDTLLKKFMLVLLVQMKTMAFYMVFVKTVSMYVTMVMVVKKQLKM